MGKRGPGMGSMHTWAECTHGLAKDTGRMHKVKAVLGVMHITGEARDNYLAVQSACGTRRPSRTSLEAQEKEEKCQKSVGVFSFRGRIGTPGCVKEIEGQLREVGCFSCP
jgi:hypothetical protein